MDERHDEETKEMLREVYNAGAVMAMATARDHVLFEFTNIGPPDSLMSLYRERAVNALRNAATEMGLDGWIGWKDD